MYQSCITLENTLAAIPRVQVVRWVGECAGMESASSEVLRRKAHIVMRAQRRDGVASDGPVGVSPEALEQRRRPCDHLGSKQVHVQ